MGSVLTDLSDHLQELHHVIVLHSLEHVDLLLHCIRSAVSLVSQEYSLKCHCLASALVFALQYLQIAINLYPADLGH